MIEGIFAFLIMGIFPILVRILFIEPMNEKQAYHERRVEEIEEARIKLQLKYDKILKENNDRYNRLQKDLRKKYGG